jgi:hypothetical protein
MRFSVTPSYKEVFKEPPPDIDSLIKDIPSKVVIRFLSALNAELFFEDVGIETQRKIIIFWSQHFTDEQKKKVFNGFLPFINPDNPSSIFALWYTMEFIQRELTNFRDFEFENTTPDQEFRLLKAYLVVVGECNESHTKRFKEDEGLKEQSKFKFQKALWPMFCGQFDFNNKIEPSYQAIKTYVLLKFLENDRKTAPYVHNFLKSVERNSILHYVMDLLTFVKDSQKHDPREYFKTFSFSVPPEFCVIFDSWCINYGELRNSPEKLKDYKGIREKPLYKVADEKYVAMNWSFLYNQLNLGLLFSFYKVSGIKELYKDFPTFRSRTSKEVSESIIFQGVFKKALSGKHTVTLFSGVNDVGFPDCYHRDGKFVLLFEFKDVLMPADVIGSENYEAIKGDIDKKFVESNDGKKGVRQLLNQMQKLNEKCFDGDDFELRGIKKRNIVVYPVIVFTHFMYSMPGINSYLNHILSDEISKINKSTPFEFGQIKDLVMVDFEFFYRHFREFQTGSAKVRVFLDNYISKIKKAREKALKVGTTQNVLHANQSFGETQVSSKHNLFKDSAYVSELFDAIGIKEESATR